MLDEISVHAFHLDLQKYCDCMKRKICKCCYQGDINYEKNLYWSWCLTRHMCYVISSFAEGQIKSLLFMYFQLYSRHTQLSFFFFFLFCFYPNNNVFYRLLEFSKKKLKTFPLIHIYVYIFHFFLIFFFPLEYFSGFVICIFFFKKDTNFKVSILLLQSYLNVPL